MAYQGSAGKPLEGEPLDMANAASDVPGSAPSSARAMQQQPPSASAAAREEGASSKGIISAAAGGSEVGLDDWELKSAAVKAQLQEAAEWFKDEDVVKLMEGARNSRGSSSKDAEGGGEGAGEDVQDGVGGVGMDLPDASMPVIFM